MIPEKTVPVAPIIRGVQVIIFSGIHVIRERVEKICSVFQAKQESVRNIFPEIQVKRERL